MRPAAVIAFAAVLASSAAWAQDMRPVPRKLDDSDHRQESPAARAVAKPAKTAAEFAKTAAEPPSAEKSGCLPERDLKIDPAVGQPLHVGMQSYSRTIALGDREVVLTFDDGPLPETTPRILQALKDACVHATFFLVGRQTQTFPRLARRERDEGHSVGHHSNTHPSFTLRGFDEASAVQDIENGIAADETAIYGAAATPRHPHVPFFRFPGFADTPALLGDLDRRGIAVFGSDLWAADWLMMTPQSERERVMAALEKRPHHNGIILFHDTRRSTAKMLPELLAELKAKGYRVVHLVYQESAPSPPLTAPSKSTPETVKIIAHLRTPIEQGSHHLDAAARAPSGGNDALDQGRP